MKGRIPIREARTLSEQYQCPAVIIFAVHDGGERFTVTTYGATRKLCRYAGDLGGKIARAILGGDISPAPAEPMGVPNVPMIWDDEPAPGAEEPTL